MAVLLGVAHRRIKREEKITWQTNKIGGFPNWITRKAEHVKCVLCGQLMPLTVQIYCPLGGSPYHRCLYVFVCLKKTCYRQNCGWRVFREQVLDEATSQQHASDGKTNQKYNLNVQQDDWSEGQDDWGEGQGEWGEGQYDWDEASESTCKSNLSNHVQANIGNVVEQLGHIDKEGTRRNTDVMMTMSGDAAVVMKNSGSNSARATEDIESLAQMSIDDTFDSDSHDVGDSPSTEVLPSEELAVDKMGIQRMMELMAGSVTDEADLENKSQNVSAQDIPEVVAFPAYYLNVFEETSDFEPSSDVASLLHDYEQREGKRIHTLLEEDSVVQKQSGAITEMYEKTHVRHGDYQCHKFIMRLKGCPEQCIRYHWNGSPLLTSQSTDGTLAVEKCPCGDARVFEFQLVPPILQFLQIPGCSISDPAVEFGTVLIFTCKSSCWSQDDIWKEEHVMLQQDPDQHLFQ